MINISPSILSADFGRLGQQIAEIEQTGVADRLHIDVMDGHFVPNITIGPVVVGSIRPLTRLLLEVHLMIENPGRYVESFAKAGADLLIVHVEACPHLHRDVELIRQLGVRPGVALNPATPPASVSEILGGLHQVLVMSVNPGFGGQSFIPGSLARIEKMRSMLREGELEIEVGVDGGISASLAPEVVKAGANVLVSGSAVFNHPRGISFALREMRDACGLADVQ
ncbi:MAG: ribulose-phosphate 3-epimerase [Chloroflexi bacterium]|nr:ribulose-phosphate 3-epimerase [Chloroflexota bacterium]